MAGPNVHAAKNARLLQTQKNISLIKTAILMGSVIFFGFAYLLAKFINLY